LAVRLFLDTITALLERLPDLRLEAVEKNGGRKRKYARQRQEALARLLSCSYEHCHKHETEPGASAFSRNFLVDELHADKNGAAYAKLLEPFYDFPHGKRGFSKDLHQTKAYYLNAAAINALQAVYEGNTPMRVLDEHDNVVTRGDLPTNGIPAPLDKNFSVPSVIDLPLDHLDRAIAFVNGLIMQDGECRLCNPEKGRGMTLGECRRYLYACRQWTLALGGLPNLYNVASNGRLAPTTMTHTINLPRSIRRLVFDGSGLVDYDFASCYWSIFRSLGRAIGFPTRYADGYIKNRHDWLAMWVGVTGSGTVSDYKQIALSWLSGATLSAFPSTEGAKLVGPQAMTILSANGAARSLYTEVRVGMKRIKEYTKEIGNVRTLESGRHVYVNAVGAELKTEGNQGDFARICSHLLTGYEQYAMRTLCPFVPGLTAVVYDGFLAPRTAVAPLVERVRERSRNELAIELDMTLEATPLDQQEPAIAA
jgi:hypothetical protein